MKKFLLLVFIGVGITSLQAQNYIDVKIIKGAGNCEKGGTTIEVYDDVDGDDNPIANPSVDFYLDSFTFCYGMNMIEINTVMNQLRAYVDIEAFDENGTTINELYDFEGKMERDGFFKANVMMGDKEIITAYVRKRE